MLRSLGVCDVDRTALHEARDRITTDLGSCPGTWSDYYELLSDQRPDVVAIATASHLHAQMAVDAFKGGAHVLVEKPLALSAADLEQVRLAKDAAGTQGTVGYVLRFLPHIRALKEAVDADRFGRILHASINVHWNRNAGYYEQARWRGTWERDGGALMNQCTHGIDMLQWIVGSPARRVHGTIRRFQRPIEAEDFGTAIVEFESGAVGTIVGSVNVYPTNHDETLSVFGEKGTVVIGGRSLNEVLTWEFEDSEENEAEAVRRLARNDAGRPVGHHALYADFLQAIREDREPLVTIEDAARSVQIVLGIYKSAKEGRPVGLPTDFATTDMHNYFE
jgi:predicted dehydrogenase